LNPAIVPSIADMLVLGGWLDQPGSREVVSVKEAFRNFANFVGLVGSQEDQVQAATSLARQRRCGLADKMALAATTCKWTTKQVLFCLDWPAGKSVQGIGRSTAADLYERAVNQWAAFIKLPAAVTSDKGKAHVVTRLGKIDGAGNVVAWSELPCGAPRQLSQLYDTAEFYTTEDALLNVFLHEHGHAWGLEHGPLGTVMQPWADASLTALTGTDLNSLWMLYDQAKPEPTPTPTPPQTPVEILFNGPLVGRDATGREVRVFAR
jgi:hypothetical protein